MTGSWLELAIIAVIILGIGISIWKGGQANPEGTGTLQRRVDRIDGDVKALAARVAADAKATNKALGEIKDGLRALDTDIEGLKVSAAERHSDLAHVRQTVDRIMDHIVQKGMGA